MDIEKIGQRNMATRSGEESKVIWGKGGDGGGSRQVIQGFDVSGNLSVYMKKANWVGVRFYFSMLVPLPEGEVRGMEREVSGFIFGCQTRGHFGKFR